MSSLLFCSLNPKVISKLKQIINLIFFLPAIFLFPLNSRKVLICPLPDSMSDQSLRSVGEEPTLCSVECPNYFLFCIAVAKKYWPLCGQYSLKIYTSLLARSGRQFISDLSKVKNPLLRFEVSSDFFFFIEKMAKKFLYWAGLRLRF